MAAGPLVFLSSIVDGYEEYRDGAAQGIEKSGCRPVRFEDQPSLNVSPRNACLDLIDACDVYVLLVAGRGGWAAPSGLKVTEEEFHHARKSGKPILVFLQDCDRDSDAARLAADASNYTAGRLRRTFSTPGELRDEVLKALDGLLPTLRITMRNHTEVQSALMAFDGSRDDVLVRVCTAPERQGELLDVLRFGDDALRQEIYRVGHEPSVGLFSYEEAKEARATKNALTLVQGAVHGAAEYSRVDITSTGLLIVETNVTGRARRELGHDMSAILSLLESDVASGVDRCLRGATALLDLLDPYVRHEKLLLNAALAGIGHRSWREAPEKRSSYPVRMSNKNDFAAFPEPRSVTREELRARADLSTRIVGMLRREVEAE